MRSGNSEAPPARLEAARRRFDQWRRTRNGQWRIPERLWTSAVKLAGVYGLCRTARTLGLDSNALKRRVQALDAAGPCEPQAATAFVELLPAERRFLPECTVELEHPHGAKMRICLTGHQSLEIVTALSQVFLGIQP